MRYPSFRIIVTNRLGALSVLQDANQSPSVYGTLSVAIQYAIRCHQSTVFNTLFTKYNSKRVYLQSKFSWRLRIFHRLVWFLSVLGTIRVGSALSTVGIEYQCAIQYQRRFTTLYPLAKSAIEIDNVISKAIIICQSLSIDYRSRLCLSFPPIVVVSPILCNSWCCPGSAVRYPVRVTLRYPLVKLIEQSSTHQETWG